MIYEDTAVLRKDADVRYKTERRDPEHVAKDLHRLA